MIFLRRYGSWMDKLTKFLKKLDSKERDRLKNILSLLFSGATYKLDIKKLKDRDDVYRVRAGNLRIIFKKENDDLQVLDVGRRNERTYRDF